LFQEKKRLFTATYSERKVVLTHNSLEIFKLKNGKHLGMFGACSHEHPWFANDSTMCHWLYLGTVPLDCISEVVACRDEGASAILANSVRKNSNRKSRFGFDIHTSDGDIETWTLYANTSEQVRSCVPCKP